MRLLLGAGPRFVSAFSIYSEEVRQTSFDVLHVSNKTTMTIKDARNVVLARRVLAARKKKGMD